MPEPFQPKTLYDFIDSMGGGVNNGDTPLDLPKDVMSNSINTTVSGKNATHRPPYYNRPVTYVNVIGQISATQTAVQTGTFQGATEEVVLDDTGNAFVIALISGRVFSFGISGNVVTCTELLIYAGGPGNSQVPIAGGRGTATTTAISNATITGATISMSGAYTGTIVGTAVTVATVNEGTITAGTVTGGSIISAAGVVTTITSGTISAGFVQSGTITTFNPATNNGSGGSVCGPGTVTAQAWLWQSECWVIIEDGTNNAIVVNLNSQTAVRSNYGAKVLFSTTTSSSAAVAPVGSTFSVTFTSVSNLNLGDYLFIAGTGNFIVTNIASTTVTMQTVSGNGTLNSGEVVTWNHTSTTFPPGRMGAYGQGRNWLASTTPYQFIALDLVGGSSGTTNYLFRDAVLNSTENNFIVGGGSFSVPSTKGPITAMKFMAQIDDSLGQGPLVVYTHKAAYFCQAPVDRLTWQNLTNPILPQAKLSYGAKGQWSTITANSDMIFRSVDGIRSMTLDRQSESGQWGDVPCSFEVSSVLSADNLALLNYGSAVVFQNRLLHTVGPVSGAQGVYWTGLVPLNFAPISSLRGKAPSVWDSGVWVGSGPTSQMNIFQMFVGEVTGVERAFALVMNTTSSVIEFWEILADAAANNDYDGTNQIPIPWQFDTASLRFGIPKNQRAYMYLSNGEIWIYQMTGTVKFNVLYKQDQYPGWTP